MNREWHGVVEISGIVEMVLNHLNPRKCRELGLVNNNPYRLHNRPYNIYNNMRNA